MDDECRVVEGGTFFTRHLGCLSRDSRRPLFLVCLVADRSRGNGAGWGERERVHVGDRITNSMGAFVPVLVRLGGCND